MKVLFVTSEVAPIKKFGGLGDFSASLPKALSPEGIDIDVIIPFYSDAKVSDLKVFKSLELEVAFNNANHTVEFHKTKLPNSDVDVILARFSKKFSGDFISDTDYFSFFDRCVVTYIQSQYNTYDVIHCNDWHTGFITHLLEEEIGASRPKTLITIHNLAYQGVDNPDLVREVGLLPGHHPLIDWDLNDGDINMLFQAITSSDYVNTVSPTYAKELTTKEFGGDFAEVIKQRSDRFVGILNGVDYSALPRDYDSSNWQEHKTRNIALIRELLGLSTPSNDTDKPVVSFISRLDFGQKGLDILYDVIPTIVKLGGQFILLGTGDKTWEQKLKDLEKDSDLKENISINIEFNSKLALSIYEGSNFFLIPSKYEPCGLTQMMSMRYGALPIVRNTGGLKDTVKHKKNGFVFDDYSKDAFIKAIEQAFTTYKDKQKYSQMVEQALNEDFSWKNSAQMYKNLYFKMKG